MINEMWVAQTMGRESMAGSCDSIAKTRTKERRLACSDPAKGSWLQPEREVGWGDTEAGRLTGG